MFMRVRGFSSAFKVANKTLRDDDRVGKVIAAPQVRIDKSAPN